MMLIALYVKKKNLFSTNNYSVKAPQNYNNLINLPKKFCEFLHGIRDDKTLINGNV